MIDLSAESCANLNLLSSVESSVESNVKSSVESKLYRAKYRVYFAFFEATDKQDIISNALKIPQYNVKKTKFVRGKELNYGELACFHSHFRVWQECVRLDSPIIVLEDDIVFSEYFATLLPEILDSCFEYVRLMYLFTRNLRRIDDNFYLGLGNLSGAQGYYLTPSAARKFITNAQSWFHCVDNYMDMFFIHNVLNIVYKPFLIGEDKEISIISSVQISYHNDTKDNKNEMLDSTQHTLQKPKMSLYSKLTRELSRIYYFNLRKPLFLLFSFARIAKLKR